MELVRNEKLLYATRKINLDIQEISYGYLDSEWTNENLCAAFTRIYIPLSGEGRIRYGDTALTLSPGNIYLVPSGLSFSSECEERMEKIYIHLTLTHPDGSDVFFGVPRALVLAHATQEIERIQELYHSLDLSSVLQLKTLLSSLLLRALALCRPIYGSIRPYSEVTQAALSYIEDHLSAQLGIREIAEALFISPLALQKAFRSDLGKPIGTYMNDSLMARAERELLDTTRSIKEISERLGYCDQFYFSRRFSQTHGINPRKFRLERRV